MELHIFQVTIQYSLKESTSNIKPKVYLEFQFFTLVLRRIKDYFLYRISTVTSSSDKRKRDYWSFSNRWTKIQIFSKPSMQSIWWLCRLPIILVSNSINIKCMKKERIFWSKLTWFHVMQTHTFFTLFVFWDNHGCQNAL